MRSWVEVFKYNQHFVAMMNIINLARLNPPTKGHNHHIIPKCWFKLQIGKERSEITKKRISEGRKGIHTGGECFKGMKWKVVNNKRVWYKGEE